MHALLWKEKSGDWGRGKRRMEGRGRWDIRKKNFDWRSQNVQRGHMLFNLAN